MKKIYTYITNAVLALSIFAFAAVLAPQVVLAGGEDDWGYGGWGSDDYYYEFEPNYYSSSYNDDYYYEFEPNYYSTGYDYSYTPSYSYSSGGGGGYTYYPSSQYVYTPTRSSGGGGSSGGGLQYVYTSSSSNNTNTNTNTNTATANNTNTITNTFNPVNNNDARINLVVLGGGGSGNNNNNYQSLSGSCAINPSTAYVNQDVSFSATASGGNGGYTYTWTGDNGLNSSSQSFTGRFSYPGVKTATVTIRSSDGQTITRSCTVNVQDSYVNTGAYCVANPTVAGINQNVTWTVYPPQGNLFSYMWYGTDGLSGYGQSVARSYSTPGQKTATVTLTSNSQSYTVTCATNIQGVAGTNVTVLRDQIPTGTPVSGVFLNQVPDTGISLGLKTTLFTLGLVLWSIFGAYMLSRKTKLQTVHGATSKAHLFKIKNMTKKGIIA